MKLPEWLKNNANLLFALPVFLATLFAFYVFYQKRLLEQRIWGEVVYGSDAFNIYAQEAASLTAFIFLALLSLKIILNLSIKTRENHELTQKLENRNEALSLASHELYTPLSNIKNSLYVIEPELPEDFQKYAQRAIVSCEQLIKLLDNLLAISRFESGKIKLNREPINLTQVAHETVGQFLEAARRKGLTLNLREPKDKLPDISADKERIREILINFLSNAVKYSDKGTINLTIERKGTQAVVSVSDTGRGIAASEMINLFKRFSRAGTDGEKERTKGIGLGLYMSRLIVEAHHGKIWAQSSEGNGSTFSFSLPV